MSQTIEIDTRVARMMRHIEGAYWTVISSRENNGWVKLSEIRDYIDAPKEIINEAYRMLGRRADVILIPESNQKILSQEDWDAAAWIGNRHQHLIKIMR